MQRILRFIGIYFALTVAAALVWLLWSYPKFPQSISGWAWLLVLALPLQIAGEFIGQIIWDNKVTRAIELRTADHAFSWVRIGYRLFGALVIIGGVIGVSFWLKTP